MKEFAYKNAEQDNLWDHLTRQAYADSKLNTSLTIKSIMDTWTLKKGYPVVALTRDYANNKLTLKQNWFLLNPLNTVGSREYKKYKWYVPFTHTSKSEKNFDLKQEVTWLKPEDKECKPFSLTHSFNIQHNSKCLV